MRTFTSNNTFMKLVTSTPKNKVAINKGDVFRCPQCNSHYVFTSEIKGQAERAAKHHLHQAHALDCPTYTPVNQHAGIRKAIRQAVINLPKKGKNKGTYEGKRYKVAIVGDSFIVIDKNTNTTYRAYYEGRKLKIERVWN